MQGRPGDDMYIGKDSYKNVVVKKGTVLYTLLPLGPNTPSYFVDDKQLSSTHGKGARTYNDALQVGHTGNSTGKYARDMRTTLHKFVVTEDTCMAFGEAKANPQFGSGGGKQYYVMGIDKKNLKATGKVFDIK